MAKIMEILFKWQTLIGGILGGLFALAAALVVAYSLRRREEVASAMLLAADLTTVRVSAEAFADLAKKQKIVEEEYPLWFAEKLVYSHPSLSVLFEASLARIMPVDASLSAHLILFHKIYSDVEVMLERLAEEHKHLHEHKRLLRTKEHFEADSRLITEHVQRVVRHASCADLLISRLILSRISFWHRLRRHVWMKKDEKECIKLLKKGSN